MKYSRGMGKVAASKKPKRKSRYAEGGEAEEPDLSYYGEAEPTPPREVDPELLRDLSSSTVEGPSPTPPAPQRRAPPFSLVPRSIFSDAVDVAKDIKNSLPPEVFNFRFGPSGVGYEFDLGNKQSITPTIGKDRIGVTYKLGFKKGGKVSSASKRGDGCAQRGKTRGKMV